MKQGATTTMNQIGSFIGRLTSRKFLITVFLGLSLLAAGQYDAAVTLALAFITAEGVGDAAERYGNAKAGAVTAINHALVGTDEDDDIDTSVVLPGSAVTPAKPPVSSFDAPL